MALTRLNLKSSDLPTGSVLQTVSANITASDNTTSSSFVDSTLSATITPVSTSSKILIIANLSMYNAGINDQAVATVFRGTASSGTNLGHSIYGFGSAYSHVGRVKNVVSVSYLDSPATTSAQVYTAAILRSGSVAGAYINVNNEKSTLTLMEIAG